jgi:RND family efflux transporter MFP subunit
MKNKMDVVQGDLPFWIPVLLAIAMLLAFTGCSRHAGGGGGHAGGPQQAPPPPTVVVAPAEQKMLVDWEEFTGRTAPTDYVEVRARVSGHIHEIRFKAGQMVKKDDVLFVIDPRWAKAAFARAEAAFAEAKVHYENAQREAGRTKQLLENKAISAEEGESRTARSRESEAALGAAEAALNTAKLDLEITEVKAPITGRVSRELVTVGNTIAAGNTILTTIVSVDPIFVYADVDENSYLRISNLMREGKMAKDAQGRTPVELQLGDSDTFSIHGFIESFDNKLDPNTGSIIMRALFPNEDGRIIPGLFARVRLPASQEYPAVLISEEAIGTDQNQKFVLTLTETNTAAYRPVKLGPQHEGKRVVREGLKPGEQIVVTSGGMARVRPGMPVTPQPIAATNGARVAQAGH